MPWDEASPMQQRARFLVEFSSCLYTMSELCRRYGISRKTGYKWAERFAEGGVAEFQDRPRRPKSCPHRTPPEIESALLEFRKRHPRWGPRKLLVRLEERSPEIEWPAASTIGDLLKRHGLVTARRFRPRPSRAPLTPLSEPRQANDLWTTDFKGQFRLGDGRWCYPLTVADAASRYLLAVAGLDSTQEVTAWPIFEDLFREYGLPAAIRSDNGSPFASVALGRLSRLSVRWLKLGIRLERIAPGHPEQNGAHERMHRTLKDETARPPAATASAQQACFDAFRQEYNEERPHEALGQRTPASRYRSSRRRYPKRPPEPQYPGHFEVRSVRSDGQIKWQGAYLFVSEALAGERVGLEETRDGEWSISFGAMLLGRFDAKERKVYG